MVYFLTFSISEKIKKFWYNLKDSLTNLNLLVWNY